MDRRTEIEICSSWILCLAIILAGVHGSVGRELVFAPATSPSASSPPSPKSEAPSAATEADGLPPSWLISPSSPISNAPTAAPLDPDTPPPWISSPAEPPTGHSNFSDLPPSSPRAAPPRNSPGPAAPPAGSSSPEAAPPPVGGLFPVSSPVPHEAAPPPLKRVVLAPAPGISPRQGGGTEDDRRPAASPPTHRTRKGAPMAAAPPKETPHHSSPRNHVHVIAHVPASSSPPPPAAVHHKHSPIRLSPATAPAISNRHRATPLPPSVSPPSYTEGPAVSPAPSLSPVAQPKNGGRHHAPPPFIQSAGPSTVPVESPSSFESSPEASPMTVPSSSPVEGRTHPRSPSPSASFSRKPKAPVAPPFRVFPPPPPNLCHLTPPCADPYTNPLPGSPCVCVLPMKVKLRLSVALFTFFPLVSELALEIGNGIFMDKSQVHIMGANAASEQPEKTIVLVDLVPVGQKIFDHASAFRTYERFWRKQIGINAAYFGNYDVLYVHYPGLPLSPPLPTSDMMDDAGGKNEPRTIEPLGVDVRKRREKLSASIVAVLVVSSVIAVVLCAGATWFLLLKLKRGDDHMGSSLPGPPHTLRLPWMKNSLRMGRGAALLGSGPSSISGSLCSSMATYTGANRTFSLGEMERATGKFDDSRIVGEGGFGRVYQGALEDGTMVAVKVLKRDDQQGGREFLAEIEMLSRLHHRNLVKLIGLCAEEHLRCLVYELIPNGSVESHLHGVDREVAPLDWASRIKIALGSARALAYLHEDSSPPVIHRDFKSSNILLEHNFTPKVSDFGLARAALNEGKDHISTRVMGTFGYVAPEYALTGHLLVKSDVYSYGVVLLELLTGRKPVDMSQPPGQENLVAWAHPLLARKEDLEAIVDPALGSSVPFDGVAKVAAIASMCVQPEVSHRPSMGEVVQALKLVCNDGDNPGGSGRSFNPEDEEAVIGAASSFSVSANPRTSAGFAAEARGSLRRHSSSSEPLRTGGSGRFSARNEVLVRRKPER